MTESFDRREFVARIGAGFAFAALPLSSWIISTSSENLDAGPVRIPTAGGTMPAYRASPKGKKEAPVVLVVQEIFGIHEHIQDVCRRLAKLGYYAIAPSLYFRLADVTKMTEIPKIISEVVSKTPQKQVWSDLDATLSFVGKTTSADVSRLGVTGFCWGGGVTWTYCAHNPGVKAGVAWYGKLTAAPTPEDKSPIELVPQLKVPVLGLYGSNDQGIPLSDVEKMRMALQAAHSTSEIIVYPGAEHGFHADYRPSYNEQAARDGWAKLHKWFQTHGMR
jgi:carboxymethylenebutenolidase